MFSLFSFHVSQRWQNYCTGKLLEKKYRDTYKPVQTENKTKQNKNNSNNNLSKKAFWSPEEQHRRQQEQNIKTK